MFSKACAVRIKHGTNKLLNKNCAKEYGLLAKQSVVETSRDRPKSAPYPRLKNSKKTSKCQVFSFTVLENRKFYEKIFSKKLHTQKMDRVARRGPLARAPGALKGGHFQNCQHFCRS